MSMDIVKQILSNKTKLDFNIVDDVSIGIFIKKYTTINDIDIIHDQPKFCLDNLGRTKLKDYRNREYVAYRNHRASSYSWGNRDADIEEIKNQINCIYNIYE